MCIVPCVLCNEKDENNYLLSVDLTLDIKTIREERSNLSRCVDRYYERLQVVCKV